MGARVDRVTSVHGTRVGFTRGVPRVEFSSPLARRWRDTGRTMSQQDIEIVRRSFDAWNEGDIEAIRRCYAHDVVIEGGTQLGCTLDSDDPGGALGG